MTWRGDTLYDLAGALRAVRTAVAGAVYPLNLAYAAYARADAAALVHQVDDYLLPRLTRLDAPMLAVVGGSTGAGKSTLVNSLVRAPVSAAGVMRPTTKAPVLICHPADAAWFRNGVRLGGFTRTGGHTTDSYRLHQVAATALPPGVALLDTPDIDSVVDAHRDVATQLLAAADLWLFVTTASRYADAVPWEMLRTARRRGTAVAVVLNRVPEHACAEVTSHLTEMLTAQGFRRAPLFVLPETWVDGQGMLPEAVTGQVRRWLDALATDQHARDAVTRATLDGALAAVSVTADELARAVDEQFGSAEALAEQVGLAYGTVRSTVEYAIRSGAMLRGEVLTRWEEMARTGQWAEVVRAAATQRAEPATGGAAGSPSVGQELRTALATSLVTLVRSAAADGADAVEAAWRGHAELAGAPPESTGQLERVVYDWQRSLLDLVRSQRADGTTAFAINATALLVMIRTFASTTPTSIAAATGQDGLAAELPDPVIGDLADHARTDLLYRIGQVLDDEAAGYLERLVGVPLDDAPAARLREAAAELERLRRSAGLTGGRDPRPAPASGTQPAPVPGTQAAPAPRAQAAPVPGTQAAPVPRARPAEGYPDARTTSADTEPSQVPPGADRSAAARISELAARQEAGR